jgi:alpha-galactosidase
MHMNAPSAGDKYVKIHFSNDIAFATSFGSGTNTRNLTLSVNGNVQRVEVPLSGRSSELFSVGKGWEDGGIFGATLSGWKQGFRVSGRMWLGWRFFSRCLLALVTLG